MESSKQFTDSDSIMVRASATGAGGCGFDPGPGHTKDFNQRINGPVNAHLRSAVYTNVIENIPSIGADEAIGPFFFFSE